MMEDDTRPNPDEILRSIRAENPQERQQGSLKIFFGACAGVGKTYAMLLSAQEKIDDGIQVLAGVVETHGRPETQELLKNIPILPPVEMDYKGIKIKEFDLDGALKAKPTIILMDELAHTNSFPTSRHPKRWMDVLELLEAGINVYSTLNVQHLESLNDIVSAITGIQVKETVPDSVLDRADDIVLVDLPSDELLERLKEGKIYISDMGKSRAAENFFRFDNLIALREMALRQTAERVDVQREIRTPHMPAQSRPVLDRIAVCVGSEDFSTRLIRSTKLLANSLKAPWFGLYVENERHYRQGSDYHLAVDRNLRFVEQLGGKAVILHGENAALSIMDYADKNHLTKLIVGKSIKPRWKEFFQSSLVTDLIRCGTPIDIYVISDREDATKKERRPKVKEKIQHEGSLRAVTISLFITLGGLLFRHSPLFDPADIIMIYFMGIVYAAIRYEWRAATIATLVSVLGYGLFLMPPFSSFSEALFHIHNVPKTKTIIAFSMMLGSSFFIGYLTSRLQSQSRYFQKRSSNIEALYAVSQQLTSSRSRKNIVDVIRRHLEGALHAYVTIWFPVMTQATEPHENNGNLVMMAHPHLTPDLKEEAAIRWAYEKKQRTGKNTSTLPSARGYYLPIEGSSGVIAVLGLIPQHSTQELTSEEYHVLETLASLATPAIERATIVKKV